MNTTDEKERLEIIVRKLDIQKRRLELREKKIALAQTDQKLEMEQCKITIEKVNNLRSLLSDFTIDTEATLFPSEPKLKAILNESEAEVVKKKLFELVEKL